MANRHCDIGLSVLVIAIASTISGCESSSLPAEKKAEGPKVTVSQPLAREITDFDDYEGRIAAEKTVEVRARVRGYLTKVTFQDGDIIKEGALLYEIDPRPYQATLDAAKAQQKAGEASVQLAQAEYERTRLLVSQNAASRQELEVRAGTLAVAKAELLKAQAAVEQANLDLGFTKITAPIGGKISRTLVDVGNLVNAGGGETLLTTITSVEPMYVYFDVDERALLRYRRDFRGAKADDNAARPPIKELKIPVQVGLEGEEGYPHHGVLDFAENKVDPTTGTIQARGVLANTKRLLDAGMRARVRIPVSDPHKILMVPARAVANDQGQKFLYTVDDKDVVKRRNVKLGRPEGTLQVILEGLKPEEWVIVDGIQFVREDMEVKPERRSTSGAGATTSLEPTKQDAKN
jgi:RND family efflux transporter MFP subunit